MENQENMPRCRRWPLSAFVLLGMSVVLGLVAIAGWISERKTRTTARRGLTRIISIADPRKTQLFARSLSCPLTDEWMVDFAGDGSPYRVQQRHCDAQQLSGIALPKSPQPQDELLKQGYDFLLVIRPSLNELIHGEFEEGRYTSVQPIRFQSRENVAVNGMIWGTSGDHDWCLLGRGQTGKVSCWEEQTENLAVYVRRTLRVDEQVKPGWSIEGAKGRCSWKTTLRRQVTRTAVPVVERFGWISYFEMAGSIGAA